MSQPLEIVYKIIKIISGYVYFDHEPIDNDRYRAILVMREGR